jgi:hypothetical protein
MGDLAETRIKKRGSRRARLTRRRIRPPPPHPPPPTHPPTPTPTLLQSHLRSGGGDCPVCGAAGSVALVEN